MKLSVPVNNIENLKKRIGLGAKEVYFGIDDDFFSSLSFTGRGKYGYRDKINMDKADAKYSIAYAHDHGVKVNILANIPFFANKDNVEKRSENYYLQSYIEKAINLGTDSIVVGDIGVLYWIYQQKYPIKIHASIFFNTLNVDQLIWFKELGVNRAILPYQISLDEIKRICSLNLLEIEVPGYKGCSFYNGICSFLHEYGESKNYNSVFGQMCKQTFEIRKNDQIFEKAIFDTEQICSLCSLKELEKAGVTTLKIVGREQTSVITDKVIELYQNKLNGKESEVFSWWENRWCKNKKCKFIARDIFSNR